MYLVCKIDGKRGFLQKILHFYYTTFRSQPKFRTLKNEFESFLTFQYRFHNFSTSTLAHCFAHYNLVLILSARGQVVKKTIFKELIHFQYISNGALL